VIGSARRKVVPSAGSKQHGLLRSSPGRQPKATGADFGDERCKKRRSAGGIRRKATVLWLWDFSTTAGTVLHAKLRWGTLHAEAVRCTVVPDWKVKT